MLYEEAAFFQLAPLQVELERWKSRHERESLFPEYECVMVHVAPELEERISVSAHPDVIGAAFPNIKEVMSSSTKVTWNQDSTHIIRFPLTDYCNLNSVQVCKKSRFEILNWI